MTCFKVAHLEQLPEAVNDQLEKLTLQSHQLLLLVGMNTADLAGLARYPKLSISDWLCEKLLPLANKRRADAVEPLLDELLLSVDAGPVLLDRIQVLFEPSLQLDVLRCLKKLSKSRTIVVNWPGSCNGAALNFSAPGKPDYFYYSETDLSSVPVMWFTGYGE